MRHRFTFTTVAVIEKIYNKKCWKGCGEAGNCPPNPAFGNTMQHLKRFHIDLSRNPAMPFLDIYPKDIKICLHESLYTNVHSNITPNSQKVEVTPGRRGGERYSLLHREGHAGSSFLRVFFCWSQGRMPIEY